MSKARGIADLGSNDVLETTATGVDVTGTVTADGLTLQTSEDIFSWASGNGIVQAPSNLYVRSSGTGDVILQSDSKQIAKFSEGGDVSFYEDTGTTAKMVWDASAEELEIGVSTEKLELGSTFYRFRKDNENKFLIGNTSSALGSGTGLITYMYQSEPILWTHGSTERMRIDSSGRVGIGDTAPERKLHVNSGSTNECALFESTDTEVTLALKDSTGTAEIKSRNDFRFNTGGSERARLDSSGNLLVGTTSALGPLSSGGAGVSLRPDGNVYIGSSTQPLSLNVSNDGVISKFYKNGTTVGSIGTAGNRPFFASTSRGLIFVGSGAVPCTTAGAYEDNIQDLGRADGRFDDVYATNGTINTSDRNEKQDIETLSDAEQRVAQACKGLLRKFRWKDSVAEKGDDARIHFGIIAQDLQDAFTAEGLDAGRYAMFISTTWTDEETGEERTRLGVRYSELLAFIISAL